MAESTDREVVDGIRTAFEYAWRRDDWVTPVDEALAGLTLENASKRLAPESSSIREIVIHMTTWNENILERLASGQSVHPSVGAWPEPTGGEAEWEHDKRQLIESFKRVEESLLVSTLPQLLSAPYGIADLLCRITHAGYHLGQITKMREVLG